MSCCATAVHAIVLPAGPKKTTKALGDDSPDDDGKRLSDAERAEVQPWLEAPADEQTRSFFCWMPAAIALWIIGGLFGLVGAFNIWLAHQASVGKLHDATLGDNARLARLCFQGAAANAVIAGLCILGWHFMRRRTSLALFIGSFAVTLALFITLRRWVIWQMAGINPFPWLEPLLVWPFLAYSIVYGFRQSRARSS